VSLDGVLKAVKSILIEIPDIPNDPQARRVLYSKKFSNLSEDEIEDLVAIPPANLQIYTESIFSGQRNLIKTRLPISFALVAGAHKKLGKPFNAYEFIVARERARPWRSSFTDDLLRAFQEFVTLDLIELVTVEPVLQSILTLERGTFAISRALDELTESDCLSIRDIEYMPLREVMELDFFAPSSVRIVESHFDLLSLKSFYSQNKTVPSSIESFKENLIFLGARSLTNNLQWRQVSEKESQIFSSLPRSAPTSLSVLAERYVQTMQLNAEDRSSAQAFIRFLTEFLSSGAVHILRKR